MTTLIIRGAQIIGESVLAKVGEKLADYGFGTVKDKTNFLSTFENLERNLKSLSAKACDVEEGIKNAELSGKKKRKQEVEDWLKNVQIIENEFQTLENEVQTEGFIEQFFGGDRAIKLNARLCELVEQSRHFGELVLDDVSTRGEPFLKTRLVGEAFGENLERIWKFLVTDKVSSIGIYGMGGVGKSSLAKHINNQLLERPHGCVFWVTVSQECSIKMLQDKIAHVLRLDLSDEYDEDKRAVRLNRALTKLQKSVMGHDEMEDQVFKVLKSHNQSAAQEQRGDRPKSAYNKLLDYFKFDRSKDSLSEVRNALLVTAVLIATVTYQAVLTPPGGVWQDDSWPIAKNNTSNNHSSSTKKQPPPHTAGKAVMATHTPKSYGLYLIFDSLGLFASLQMMSLLILGFPLQFELTVACFAIGVTYAACVAAITPTDMLFMFLLVFLLPIMMPILSKVVRDCKNGRGSAFPKHKGKC